MPIIFCSIKLSKLIDLKQRLPSTSLNNWNGHLFILERRKSIAFVHKETLYSFVFFGILKSQLKFFKEYFLDNFLEQLEFDQLLSPELEVKIRNNFNSFELSTTDDDRSTIGYLNDCIARLKWQPNDDPVRIAEVKKYVRSYYNATPLLSRNAANSKELMAAYLKKIA